MAEWLVSFCYRRNASVTQHVFEPVLKYSSLKIISRIYFLFFQYGDTITVSMTVFEEYFCQFKPVLKGFS